MNTETKTKCPHCGGEPGCRWDEFMESVVSATPEPLSGKGQWTAHCRSCQWEGVTEKPMEMQGIERTCCPHCCDPALYGPLRLAPSISTPTGIEAMVCADKTPSHYQSPTGITPWDLQRGMKSSGNAFVDGRRCDAIKYAFRVKQNMAEDLRKAAHCLMEAVAVLEGRSIGNPKDWSYNPSRT